MLSSEDTGNVWVYEICGAVAERLRHRSREQNVPSSIPLEKANVVPVHKKESENMLKNYGPISLLPLCGKIFEKCIYNSLYSYLESNNILSKFQSGFRKGDSCILQLLAITHEIYSNFDACPSLETRGVF